MKKLGIIIAYSSLAIAGLSILALVLTGLADVWSYALYQIDITKIYPILKFERIGIALVANITSSTVAFLLGSIMANLDN